MTQKQWREIEHTILSLSPGDRLELIERLAHSLKDEAVSAAVGSGQPVNAQYKPIWEVFMEIGDSVPEEEWTKLPADGASQLDHYVYGSPKRPAS